jgi:hypothetical protein
MARRNLGKQGSARDDHDERDGHGRTQRRSIGGPATEAQPQRRSRPRARTVDLIERGRGSSPQVSRGLGKGEGAQLVPQSAVFVGDGTAIGAAIEMRGQPRGSARLELRVDRLRSELPGSFVQKLGVASGSAEAAHRSALFESSG